MDNGGDPASLGDNNNSHRYDMIVDIRTMQIVLAVSCLLMALMLWLAYPGKSHDGLALWAAALLLQGGAWVLFSMRFISHDLIAVVAGNFLFALGVAMKTVSLLKFQHRDVPLWLPWALPGVVTSLFAAALGSVEALIMLNAVAYAVAFAGIAWLMWRPPHSVSARIRWLMTGTYCAAAIGFVARGVIALCYPQALPDPYSANMLQASSYLFGFALIVMSSTGILLMHKERADELTHRLAATDPLTGVYNRRTFIELAGMALARAQRTKTPLSLVMLDLDHFKRVNDHHGHLVGDEVLKSFVRLVETCLRREDLLVRFGGEEFCVLLPEATLEGAMVLAERIRNLVADTTLAVDKTAIKVTVSSGVDSIRGGEQSSVETLLERADQALYRAKTAGRNRVASYTS